MSLYKLKVAICAANIVGLSMSFSTTTLAQTPRNGQVSPTSPAEAKKQWAEVPPLVRQCVNAMIYKEKGEARLDVTLDNAIRAGASPTDAVMEPLVNACRTLMPTEQKTNFPCNVPNSKGQQVATTCEESFVKWVNGQQVPILREDILLAARNRQKVKLGVVESYGAGIARRADERRAFEASPEGQRQAAERDARRRVAQAEWEARQAQQKREAAEWTARKKAAEDLAVKTRNCVPVPGKCLPLDSFIYVNMGTDGQPWTKTAYSSKDSCETSAYAGHYCMAMSVREARRLSYFFQ